MKKILPSVLEFSVDGEFAGPCATHPERNLLLLVQLVGEGFGLLTVLISLEHGMRMEFLVIELGFA